MTVALPEIPVKTDAGVKWTPRRETNPNPMQSQPQPERPFHLSAVFTTTSQTDADRFIDYIANNYSGFVRLEPVPNLGSAVSNIMVFHYAFPHATESFLRGMYGCLSSAYSGLCVAIGEEPMMMYSGPRQQQ